MGKFCEVCGKGVKYGNNVSHSNRKTRRTWAPNTQRVRVMVDGTPKRMFVCTRCLRSNKGGARAVSPSALIREAAFMPASVVWRAGWGAVFSAYHWPDEGRSFA